MSQRFGNSPVSITGDGNVIGESNRVTIIKKTEKHYHQGNSGGGGQGPKNEGGGEWLGVGILLAIALIGFAYWFARNADLIYRVELTLAASAMALGILAGSYNLYIDEVESAFQSILVSLMSAMLLSGTYWAYTSYPAELTPLAQASGTGKAFWCQLTAYGQQSALQHGIQSILLLAPGSLLLSSQVASHFLVCICLEPGTSGFLSRVHEKLFALPTLMITCVLSFAAMATHTDAAFEAWQEQFAPGHSFFCPAQQR